MKGNCAFYYGEKVIKCFRALGASSGNSPEKIWKDGLNKHGWRPQPGLNPGKIGIPAPWPPTPLHPPVSVRLLLPEPHQWEAPIIQLHASVAAFQQLATAVGGVGWRGGEKEGVWKEECQVTPVSSWWTGARK